jgi:sugar/nucleoside kinase (ribokinase family)
VQGPESDYAERGHARGSACDVEMVVVGHAGLATVQTRAGEQASPGGSGFAVAASAAALIGGRVGLVAQVGEDFDLTPLRQLGVNLDGVLQLPGTSARLRIEQFDDGSRTFSADLGVATSVRLDSFPHSYLDARYVHLGTAPPEQQLIWQGFLQGCDCQAQVSADMFEHYVATKPEASREVCDNADLIFMNEAEHDGLYGHGHSAIKAPLVLKRGPDGASILVDDLPRDVRAPTAEVVDPTGGGEILAGVFLALCIEGLESIDALHYAARAAASCVEDFGVLGPHLAATLRGIRNEVSRLKARPSSKASRAVSAQIAAVARARPRSVRRPPA